MGAVLVLASASPRRRQLLAQLLAQFDVVPSDVPETPRPDEPPDVFARRVAREKARDVAQRRPGAFVLGADTVVVVDHEILGKPAGRDDARRMLRLLSGRAHGVLTAVVLIDPAGMRAETVVHSRVTFRELRAEEIEAYLDTAEPYDKAGAYAVQGGGAFFIREIHGSYTNVIGLPLCEAVSLLKLAGAITFPGGNHGDGNLP
jgi:septum formation protein